MPVDSFCTMGLKGGGESSPKSPLVVVHVGKVAQILLMSTEASHQSGYLAIFSFIAFHFDA